MQYAVPGRAKMDGSHLAEAPAPGRVSLGQPVCFTLRPWKLWPCTPAALAHLTKVPAGPPPRRPVLPWRLHQPRHISYLLWLARPLADLTELAGW